jgi:hypothetical protein
MTTPAEVFRNITTWQDEDVALSLASGLDKCVGEGGEVDFDAVASIANQLVIEKPYLRRPKGSPDPALPHGPTGALVGSGRKRYGRQVNDEALRRKYPALNA